MSTRQEKHRTLKIFFATTVALLTLLTGLLVQGGSASAASLTGTIENTAIGTGVGQVQYTGSDWTACGGCGIDTGNNSYTYGYTVGSSFTLRFSGGQLKIWGVTENDGGTASVTVDGVAKGSIDTYSAAKASALIYDTGQIGDGAHTVTLTITGQDTQSSASVLIFDKADIYSADPTPTPTASLSLASTVENTTTGSGDGQVQLTGSDWTVCGGCGIDTGNNSFTYAYTTNDTATLRFTGGEAKIWGVKEVHGGIASVTVDGVAEGTIDTYAATQTSAIIYDTGALGSANASHTVVLTITGTKNSQADSTVLSFDKADIYTFSDTSTPTPTATPGGAPGLSGAGTEDPYAFGTFRGDPVQVWETWNNYQTWAEMEEIQPVHTYFTGEGQAPFNVRFPGQLSFAQPLWANDETAATCANGGDDQHYTNIATALKNAGFPGAFIRLGWEQNGDWFWWHATSANAAQWVQCFQHAYTAFKSVSSSFVIAWNPNKSTDMSGFDTRTTYPGDNYVDAIAVDFYDMYPNYPDQATWDADYNTTENGGSPVGMGAYISFANSHNKPLAFPEWGLNTQNSFDNPFYINAMADTFATLRSEGKLYWESYFNLDGCTFEVTDGCNPNASAVYVQRF